MFNSASFDVNEWNPLKEAYDNTDFNSYDCGPGKYLTMGERKPEFVEVYVKNLPRKFTEDGLRALFSKAGIVQRVKICTGKNGKPPFGFVGYAHLNEAEVAISKLNNLRIAGDEPLHVKLSFKDEKKVRDHQQKLQTSAFFKGNYSQAESSNESDSEDNYSDSKTRASLSRSEKFCNKYTQHSIPSANSSYGKQCSSKNVFAKETRKTHSKYSEKNAKLESSSDKWKYDSDEESTKHKFSQKKIYSISPIKSVNNSQDGSGMLQLKNQCANCGGEATKRCSNCRRPYCSKRCQKRDWMNGHENECFSFSNMSLQELADRFDVNLDLDTSGNKSKLQDDHSPQNHHKTRQNSSLSNHKDPNSSCKYDAVTSKRDKYPRTSHSKRESNIENSSSDVEISNKWLGSVRSHTKSNRSNNKHNTPAGNDNFEESYISPTVSNGDINELETVELPSRGTCQVLVTYINELNIYVQLSTEKNQNIQKEILCKLYKSCEDGISSLRDKSLKIGQLYACMFSEDGVWYRAMLVEILKPDKVKVKYIDFGNWEVTTVDKLRVLSPELKQVPQQAVCCVLNLPQEATSPKNSTKLAALIEKHILQDSQYLLKVVNDSTPPEVFIYDAEGNKINKKLVSSLDLNNTVLPSETTKTSSASTSQIVSSPTLMACDVPLVSGNLKYGSKHKLRVIDVKSPEDFLVQFADEPSRAFCQFTKKLSSYAESCCPALEIPFKGQLVLTKLETEKWVRAEVLDVKNDSLLVSLIDFGTEAMIRLEHYCPAMPFCLDYPCLCIPSKLESVNFLGRNDDALKMSRRFNQILKFLTKSEDFSKECILGLYMGCGNKCQWNLYDPVGETSVMDMLTSSKVMASDLKGCQVNIGDVLDGLAVEILDDSFYIIAASEKQISFLEEFNTYLEKKDDHRGYTPCIDEMVAAKFSQDNQWYRGQIISSTTDGKYKVFFVDYGNSEYVDKLQLQPFPAHFTPYPKQALHCYLPNVSGIKNDDKFSQLLCNNVCKYKIEGCTKNVYEVIVYTSDGSCINDCFEESLEKDVTNYFANSQSLNGTATPKSNSVKSASSLSISPFRSRSQSPQSSIEGQPVEALSSATSLPASCYRHHRDSSEHIFENQFSSEKKLPDDRHARESMMQSLSMKTLKQEVVCSEDMLRPNRIKYFAKSMGCLQLKVNMEYELLCKWIVDIDCFYCQILDDIAMEALTDMTEQLNKMGETSHLNSIIQPEVGEVVCCKYSDGKWYRAKVMAVSKLEFSVFYVDFGCSGRVCQDEIMPLTDELAEIPILAARCSLAGKSKEKWTKEKLLQLHEQPINVAVVGETHNSYSVVLKDDFHDEKATNATPPSNQNVSSKELILQQIEELQKQLKSMD